MLSTLRIENLAIVDKLEVEFSPGLNVLTGETGAGKSIILKAIELLSGARASADLLRAGSDKLTVEGLFYLTAQEIEQISALNEEFTELLGDEELIVRRIIDASGRSKFYINGHLSTAQNLQILSRVLVDITGQHQQQTLLEAEEHLNFLDKFGVTPKLLESVAEAFGRYLASKRKLDAFLKGREEQERYLVRIQEEKSELEAASLEAGGRAQIESKLKRLQHVETLTNLLNRALEIIEQSEDSIDLKMRSLAGILDQAVSIDNSLKEIATLIETAGIQLREAKLSITDYGSKLEVDPEELEILRARVAEIARLERKYRKPEDELVKYLAQITKEIAELEGGGLDENKLREEAKASEDALRKVEVELTAKRQTAAKRLSQMVRDGLSQLGMKRAEFSASVTATNSSETGADKVEFLLAANPGEPARALEKVASGGELSRILLVLKTILNERLGAGTQIFDEIDVGVGGAIAQIIGEKLAKVAINSQVILVTHSPQIAAMGERHLLIEKAATSSRTTTSVRALSEIERVPQIASMLAGKKISSSFEGSARELLAHRQKFALNNIA